ncbi:MAG: hypothetical protein ACOCTT_02040 [archaeon]
MPEDNIENIKQIVKSMRQTGASEGEIRKNLQQLGLKDEKIEIILHKANSENKEKVEKEEGKEKEEEGEEENPEELEKKIEGISEGFESITDKIKKIDEDVEKNEKGSEEKSVEGQEDFMEDSKPVKDPAESSNESMGSKETEKDLNGVSNKDVYNEVREVKNKLSALMNIEEKVLKTNKDILIELREKEKRE